MNEGRVFDTVEQQLAYERAIQQKRYQYTYPLSGSVLADSTSIFSIDIESGADFKCTGKTGSAFGYDKTGAKTSAYPMPLIDNAGNLVTRFAMRGLMVQVTDTNSGRNLTSGFVAFENWFTPGYGVAFTKEVPWTYLFYRNNKIKIDVRNTEPANGLTHTFNLAFTGFRYEVPEQAGR